MLTQRQHQLLQFIHGYLRDHGVPPSFEEMRAALRLKSKSGIHRLITGLVERGYIRRLPYRARALEVIRLPNGVRVGPGAEAGLKLCATIPPRYRYRRICWGAATITPWRWSAIQ